jgi:serine/threonine protein kinase
MEYAVNGDLTEFINYLGALCEPDARRLFKQLLEIVSYIHENNICHRHITCDNILLDENLRGKSPYNVVNNVYSSKLNKYKYGWN